MLADEINRTPPKTQAALLQAMQERQVTVSGRTHKLAEPFFVLATQNPIEQEGTYPLPEAQLDRFMFMVYIDYPTAKEEHLMVKQTTTGKKHAIDARARRGGHGAVSGDRADGPGERHGDRVLHPAGARDAADRFAGDARWSRST